VSGSDPKTRLTNLRERRSDSRLVPTFTILEGPELGAFHAFDPGRRAHRIGRGDDADIRLNDPSVSRVHAIAVVASLGDRLAVRLQDNGSTNGVMINGRSVAESTLISGDKVRLGDILLRFEWMAEEEIRYHSDVSERVRAAERDPLSGLLTRVYLETRLPRLLGEVDRRGQPISCLLLDLDHFKSINDLHGHLVGDSVIARMGIVLLDVLRETDTAVRYGGEEFLGVLPGLELPDAIAVAERIRNAFRDASLFDIAPGLQVTCSVGVAERTPGEAQDEWIERADRALYGAKDEGRDRVGVAEPGNAAEAVEQAAQDTMPRGSPLDEAVLQTLEEAPTEDHPLGFDND